MKNPILFLTFVFALSYFSGNAQEHNFTKQDTLKGSITKERAWWDLKKYHLDIQVFPEQKFIKGKNTITYKVLNSHQILQVDLQKPLKITAVKQKGRKLKVVKEGNAYFVHLKKRQKPNSIQSLTVYYEGYPRTAIKAPWDGGFSWKKDKNGKHFIATSCQSYGASLWWPCKDHPADEVESMDISVKVPSDLMNISNGRLYKIKKHKDNTTTYHWGVKKPNQ